MKQLYAVDHSLVHVEVTMGLRREDGTQHTTRDVTDYIKSLNRQRKEANQSRLTFKVFSGYAPYISVTQQGIPGERGEVDEDVVENVALLHLDYRLDEQVGNRFDTLAWYIERLLENFGQSTCYAHFATDNGHRMLVYQFMEAPEA